VRYLVADVIEASAADRGEDAWSVQFVDAGPDVDGAVAAEDLAVGGDLRPGDAAALRTSDPSTLANSWLLAGLNGGNRRSGVLGNVVDRGETGGALRASLNPGR
jgi:hypothetical protein